MSERSTLGRRNRRGFYRNADGLLKLKSRSRVSRNSVAESPSTRSRNRTPGVRPTTNSKPTTPPSRDPAPPVAPRTGGRTRSTQEGWSWLSDSVAVEEPRHWTVRIDVAACVQSYARGDRQASAWHRRIPFRCKDPLQSDSARNSSQPKLTLRRFSLTFPRLAFGFSMRFKTRWRLLARPAHPGWGQRYQIKTGLTDSRVSRN